MPAETDSPEEPTATFENAPSLESAGEDSPKGEEEQTREVLPPNNINEIVTKIQEEDGVDVGPDWWAANVKDGTEAEMLAQFLPAYERDFPKGSDGVRRKRPEAA